jgi:hypothetical protein
MEQILEEQGVPYFIKVDIEGSDRLAVLALTHEKRPKYLSFEISGDVEELVSHSQSIGFTRFKIINQNSFRELANRNGLVDRGRAPTGSLGRLQGASVGDGRFFVSVHSSGLVPWRSDGRWYSSKEALRRWGEARAANTLRQQPSWLVPHTRCS